MTLKELKELGIDAYPDNDGGLWYYDKNGAARMVKESDEEAECIEELKIA